MVERIIYLLSELAALIKRLARRHEQIEAQDEREQIDTDSAQYSADRFGDGRVALLDALEWIEMAARAEL